MTAPPTSGLDVSGPLPGQLVFSKQNELVTVGLAASINAKVGNPITYDASGNAILADNTSVVLDGIGVCTVGGDNSAGLARAVSIQVAMGNTYVYYTAAGAIKNFAQIVLSSITGHGAQQQTASNATAATVYTYISTTFARYFFHQGENGPNALPTAAVSGDVIAIRLGAS